MTNDPTCTGILLVDKPIGKTSFLLVKQLRRLTRERRIGHAGTLDPFATGVMVMLIGRSYTRLSQQFLTQDKEYVAVLRLGAATDTYDCDGKVIATSDLIPALDQIETALDAFQGETQQIPPMYSAKKIGGKKLYQIARAGQVIKREPVIVQMQVDLVSYAYPDLHIRLTCSKGTYVRSLADDLGRLLGCYAHLTTLKRLRSGCFTIDQCVDGALLQQSSLDVRPYLIRQTA